MARYKVVDRSPRFLPIFLDAQLMADSFEYAVDYLPRSTFEGEHFLRRLEKLDLSIVLVVLGIDSEGTNT